MGYQHTVPEDRNYFVQYEHVTIFIPNCNLAILKPLPNRGTH